MNEWERLHRQAEYYKQKYPPGTRIELLSMGSDPRPIESGTRGSVAFVDDIGTLHCDFDNGRRLGVIPGEDSFRTLTEEELFAEKMNREQEEKGSETLADFGDGCKIRVPDKAIDCSRLGYFDELEEDCWRLVKEYCATFGIELLPQEEGEAPISFDIAKGIQDFIIGSLQEAGVEFKFESQEESAEEAPVQEM